MRTFRTSDLATFAAVLLGLVAFSFTDRMPSPHAPYPLLLVYAMGFGLLPFLSIPLYVWLYWRWCRATLEGEAETPRRTQVLLFAVTLLSAAWYYVGASYGIEYQGRHYVQFCAGMSIGYAVTAYAMWWWNRRRPAPARSASLGFLVFAWLGTYAFPWFGETI